MKRITISISDELAAMLAADVPKQKVSAFIARALERQILADRTSSLSLGKGDAYGFQAWGRLGARVKLALRDTADLKALIGRGRA